MSDVRFRTCFVPTVGTIANVQQLRDRLARLRGRWVVPLNDAPAIRQIFADCDLRRVERPKGIGGGGKPYSGLIISPKAAALLAAPRAAK